MTDDAFTYTVKLKRGDDTQKCKVTATDIETLTERVDAVREKMGEWAGDYREIQPDDETRLADDQSELDEVGA
ncbi:DUF7389 domain-containing protein [Haloarcula argentinensis]|uniref:DUF7389 domain-containing protein n=1 Tax=Haloarcula argentinensis TaxID=43776 RepID=A0A847UQL1_HALAR|nr:hypothetical protein [Haloarcula argentinensis]NLV14434.1 hypothetical protein [Haloarcula argentinensis]